jgi:hypothetical protein
MLVDKTGRQQDDGVCVPSRSAFVPFFNIHCAPGVEAKMQMA